MTSSVPSEVRLGNFICQFKNTDGLASVRMKTLNSVRKLQLVARALRFEKVPFDVGLLFPVLIRNFQVPSSTFLVVTKHPDTEMKLLDRFQSTSRARTQLDFWYVNIVL
jgi:hypothetical protein